MPTVDKSIADRIIAGEFDDEPNPTQRIVKYRNAFGGFGYGITDEHSDPETYLRPTPYVQEPEIYWERSWTTSAS